MGIRRTPYLSLRRRSPYYSLEQKTIAQLRSEEGQAKEPERAHPDPLHNDTQYMLDVVGEHILPPGSFCGYNTMWLYHCLGLRVLTGSPVSENTPPLALEQSPY